MFKQHFEKCNDVFNILFVNISVKLFFIILVCVFFCLLSCWLSNENGLIWIFLVFVLLIGLVSRQYRSPTYISH